jgi:hypothetical protein
MIGMEVFGTCIRTQISANVTKTYNCFNPNLIDTDFAKYKIYENRN